MAYKILYIKNWLIVWLPLKFQTKDFYLQIEVLVSRNN